MSSELLNLVRTSRIALTGPNPPRGNVYNNIIEYYRNNFSGSKVGATIEQLIIQASITTNSGAYGAAGLIGNSAAKIVAGNERYNITLDVFSKDIIDRMLDAIEREIMTGKDGLLTAQELHFLDYSVWRQHGMQELFPGNAQRYHDWVDGFTGIASNSVIYDSALYDMHRLNNRGLAPTRDTLNDDTILWGPATIPFAQSEFTGMMAQFAETAKLTVVDFGFNDDAMYTLQANSLTSYLTSSDGRYRAYLQSHATPSGQTRVFKVVDTQVSADGGEVVAYYDPNADLYGDQLWGLSKFGAEAMRAGAASQFFGRGGDPAYKAYLAGIHDDIRNYTGFNLDAGSLRHFGQPNFQPNLPSTLERFRCFIAGTPVRMASGENKLIEQVRVGDRVAAFEGLGDLLAGEVVKLLPSSADEIVLLDSGVGVTRFHPFLCADGQFRTVDALLREPQAVVLEDGSEALLNGRIISGAQLEAHGGYYDAPTQTYRVATYNFTVATHHTYIAGGYRVHNTSLLDDLPGGFNPNYGIILGDGTQMVLAYTADGRLGQFFGRDVDGDGDTDLESYTIFHEGKTSADKTLETGKFIDKNGNGKFDTLEATYVYGQISAKFVKDGAENIDDPRVNWRTRNDSVTIFGVVDAGGIGSVFGSTLGRMLSDNQLVSTVGSVVLGAVGESLAEAFAASALPSMKLGEALDAAFENLPTEIRNGALSAVSSFITAELVHALGLEGKLGELAQSIGSAYIGQLIKNIADVAAHVPGAALGNGLNGMMAWNAVGSFVGTWLASRLVQFDSVEGQVGAAIGSAIGASVGIAWAAKGAKVGSYWGPVGALIGAFVGYIFGGLIGSLFSGGKPESSATLAWDEAHQNFMVTNVTSKNRGSKAAARSIAGAAANALDTIIAATGANLINGSQLQLGSYGMRGKDYLYKRGEQQVKSRDVQKIVNYGTYTALIDAMSRLGGGDIFVKRAILATLGLHADTPAGFNAIGMDFDIQATIGNIAVAQDFSQFMADPTMIKIAIQANPDSVFAAGWAATLARAQELALGKRAFTDWIGGFNLFLDQTADGVVDGRGVSPANVMMDLINKRDRLIVVADADGKASSALRDTIDAGAKDLIAGTAGNDTITVDGATLQAGGGVTRNGAAVNQAHTIKVAAVIDGGDGNDVIRGGDLGNDLLGGGGNDVLMGGLLDDWLLGQDGDDVLFAGRPANPSFAQGDLGAETAALAANGGNGNYLDGGDGNDRLYGSGGSDWLKGGAGSDYLVGGNGADILQGGAGDDRGANGEARILGGAGTDQYIFGFGDGRDVVFDEADLGAGSASERDSLHVRLEYLRTNPSSRSWSGQGDYEVDGSIKGGEDAIAFGAGITMQNLLLQRSGTAQAPGKDLIIRLQVNEGGELVETGDELTIKDWFESTRRVEWFRFSNGEEVRLGDMTSFQLGTGASDVILGTYGADFMYGGAGDDELRGLAGHDFGNGGSGNDFVAGDGDNDWVMGGSGNDQVVGGAGHDTVFGDDGNDRTYGGTGHDLVVGGRGNDEMIGGEGDDIFRYSRGDGRDVVLDDYVNNWDVIWEAGHYVNGYVLANGMVTKDGVVYFDGSKWLSNNDWNDEQQVLRRHKGELNGVIARNSGTDSLEFNVGIDIQDVMLRQSGNDLELGIGQENSAAGFEATSDRITIRDWFSAGKSIENFVFAATGRHAVSGMNLNGGTDGDDTFSGSDGLDWLTGNGGDDTIDGSGGDDVLAGNAGSDRLLGGAGDDVLFGGAGEDTLDGGLGADFLFGGEGRDIVSYATSTSSVRVYLEAGARFANTRGAIGDTFSDIEGIEGSSQGDRLGGDAGDNYFRNLVGVDVAFGGAGEDTYEIGAGSSVVTIREGSYTVEEIVDTAGKLNAALYSAQWTYLGFGATGMGDRHKYQLTVTRNGTGEVVYQSVAGTDFLYVNTGAQIPANPINWPYRWQASATATNNQQQVVREVVRNDVDGGTDTLMYQAGVSLTDLTFADFNGGLQISRAQGGAVQLNDQGQANLAVEYLQLNDGLTVDLRRLLRGSSVTGGSGADFIVGTNGFDVLNGGGGDDVISGNQSIDTLSGGDGNDILEGGASGNTLDGGSDSVSLGLAPVANAEHGDTVRYAGSNAAVWVDLQSGYASGGHAGGDVLVAVNGVSTIENLVGSQNYGDTLAGDARNNRLAGLGGNDVLAGRGGDDILVGGAGADQLHGNDGNDALAGDDDNDSLYGGFGKDLLSGGDGNDILYGDLAGEPETGSMGQPDDDQISGDFGDDTAYGGGGNDTIGGQEGYDVLYGQAGDDKLAGGADNDTLDGGDGADTLSGDAGNDLLYGGAGDDSYLFDKSSGSDRIQDNQGANKLLIQATDPSNIWLQRSGDDLVVSVIGGYSTIVLVGYYMADPATRMKEIATPGGSLFLKYAEPLIQAMANASATPPAVMPKAISDLLGGYWHPAGRSTPKVTDQNLTTDEDVALSGNVAAIDHDENIASYTLVTQAGMGTVSLDAATGAWVYAPAANRHGNDRFVIRVTDANGAIAEQVVNLTVVSVNDAPSNIFAPGPLEVDEGSPNGLSLGLFTHEDVDGPEDTPRYQLIDSAGGRFAMNANGELTVADGVALDFENFAEHTIRVRVTDLAGAWFEKEFKVTVRNVNEAPFTPTPQPESTIAIFSENATGGIVASPVIGDPDGTVPSLQLTHDPSGLLEIDGGTIRIKAGANANFEALVAAGAQIVDLDGDGIMEALLTARVRAHDGELGSDEYSFSFTVEDENERPTDVLLSSPIARIDERDRPAQGEALPSILIGKLGGVDPDSGGSADFALLVYSVDDARFEVVGDELRLKAGAALDFESGASINLIVTATDRGGAGLSVSRTFTFAIGDRDDFYYGTTAGENIAGGAGRDVVYGYAGADTLSGNGGNDSLYGGDGNDVVNGGDGDDELFGELGDDTLSAGAGNDLLRGGDGVDAMLGGDGNDRLFGDDGNDRLLGEAGNDTLDGGAGNDVLLGGSGADVLSGGDGDDFIDGDGDELAGSGADRMRGGAGFDTLSYQWAGSGIELNLATGVAGGGAAGDVLEDHFERVVGSRHADTITGSDANDVLEGGYGNDTIFGGAGDDRLEGGDGDDYLDAQSGNDQLIGGAGRDILVGGADSDTYLIDILSGKDEIRNFDATGEDIDVIGYQNIDRNQLWFARSGNDLVISVVGSDVETTIKDWYTTAPDARGNYKIDFVIAGEHVTKTVNAEGLVGMMADHPKPTTQAAYNALLADAQFANRWNNYWDGNREPTLDPIASQRLNEDGSLTLDLFVHDDFTPYGGITVSAQAVRVDNYGVEDLSLVNAPVVIHGSDSLRRLTLTTKPNASGKVAIKVIATDAAGLRSERIFLLDIDPVADAPQVTRAVQIGTTLDGGSLALDVQAALVDQDGSESLEIRISNLANGLSLNRGTNLGNGTWSLTTAQLQGLALVGPAGWSQDLVGANALVLTVIAKETATGQTAQTTRNLEVTINTAPTDIVSDRAEIVSDESTALTVVPNGTVLANFGRVDADNDAAEFSLTDNAGGRFAISTAGVLTVANGSLLDYEQAQSHEIVVRVRDSGGLWYDKRFTVKLRDLGEAPSTPVALTQPIAIAQENAALGGGVVATLGSQGGQGAIGFELVNDARGWFTIVGNQLKFRDGLQLDFEALRAAGLEISDLDGDGRQEAVYSVDVRAISGGMPSPGVLTISMRLEDANDAPSDITVGALAIDENSANATVIADFAAVDQDTSDGLNFSLLDNAGGRFVLTPAGRLSVANGGLLDYEANRSHNIVVRVTDDKGGYRDETFTVAVNNVNEAPTVPGANRQLVWINEGSPGAQTLATFHSTDPDGTSPSYFKSFDPWGWFNLSGNALTWRTDLVWDFETLAATGTDWWRTITDNDGDGQLEFNYAVGVQSTDGALNSPDHAWVWATVEDVNEAPTTWGQNFSVSEAAPGAGQTYIGQFAFGDSDSQGYNRDHRFAITGGNTGMFSINQYTGQIYLQGQADYEAAQNHAIQVTVTDRAGTGYSANAWINIAVTNVNELPVLIEQTYSRTINQGGVGAGTVFGSFVGYDPDGTALNYQVTSVTWNNRAESLDTFRVENNQLVANKDIRTSMDPLQRWVESRTYKVEVRATDPGGLAVQKIFTVQLNGRWGTLPPVVLDLDGDGIELVSTTASSVKFDMDADGVSDRTGWVGKDDGILVLDRNRDGKIDNGGEISFAGDRPGAISDLEGLAAYDSNGNGIFEAGDARFGEFQVWNDANQDGISQTGELSTLAARGIASINLHGVWTGKDHRNISDNLIYANSTFTRTDGSVGKVGDVFLAFEGSKRPVDPSNGHGDGSDAGSGQGGKVDRNVGLTERMLRYLESLPADGHDWAGANPAGRPIDHQPMAFAADSAAEPSERDRPRNQRAGEEAPGVQDEEFDPAIGLARSALHDNLALAQKKRFQMVEAMASFSADPYAEMLNGSRTSDPQALELLTALPDFRMSNR